MTEPAATPAHAGPDVEEGGRIISADSHVLEPHDLWTTRVSRKFRDRVPRLEVGESFDRLVFEDYPMPPIGQMAGCYRGDDEVRLEGRWSEDVPPQGYDPAARLPELDEDGIFGEVLFPTVGLFLFPLVDAPVKLELFGAYNTWLAEEFCAACPERLKGIALLAHDDVDIAVRELHRAKALGHVGVMLPTILPDGESYGDPKWDALWQASVDEGLPIHFHSAVSAAGKRDLHGGVQKVRYVLDSTAMERTFLEFIFGGVFDRHPDLLVISAENDAGWASYMVERADRVWQRYSALKQADPTNCARRPSEYWGANMKITFQRDDTAIACRDILGVDSLMFMTDFPHHRATFPNSQKILSEQLLDVDAESGTRMGFGNAAEVYGFATPASGGRR